MILIVVQLHPQLGNKNSAIFISLSTLTLGMKLQQLSLFFKQGNVIPTEHLSIYPIQYLLQVPNPSYYMI
jgi:hypothetical protein